MVGNNIGSGNIAQAKKYGKVYQLYSLIQSLLVCSLMIILSDLIASTFTSIAEVQHVTSKTIRQIVWAVAFMD